MRFPKLGIVLFMILVALDQASKLWVQHTVKVYSGMDILGSFLRVTYVLNPGGAFSTQFGGNAFYIVVASVATVVVVAYILFSKNPLAVLQVSLFMVLAGAVGNLVDRIRIGKVIDWIDVGIGDTRWPTFNIADAAIVVGLVVLIFMNSANGRKNSEDKRAGEHLSDEAGQLSGGNGVGVESEPDTETYSPEAHKNSRQGG